MNIFKEKRDYFKRGMRKVVFVDGKPLILHKNRERFQYKGKREAAESAASQTQETI